MRFSAGQELESLEFLEVLDTGDRKVAYKVRDTISRRLEYLKLVPREVLEDKESLERFMREARVHASLEHPNIARFYSCRRIDGELVMTSEWIEGESLNDKIAKGTLPLLKAVDYIDQLLTALEYAHAQGVIHRDVAPENLLITEQGVVKLTGFDSARGCADPKLTRPGVTLGSVYYMAPELINGSADANECSDLYAVGAVLHEAITGKKLFERSNQFDVMMAHVESEAEPPSRINKDVPLELDQIVALALEKDPKDRFQSASEFRYSLAGLARVLKPGSEIKPLVQSVVEHSVVEEEQVPDTATKEPSPLVESGPVEEPVPDRAQPADMPETKPLSKPGQVWEGFPETAKMFSLGLVGFTIGLLLFLGAIAWFK